MDKKLVIGIFALIAVVVAGFGATKVFNSNSVTGKDICTGDSCGVEGNAANARVKEFVMESFVEFVDGKPKPQFSLKEIAVNKGDLVRIKITVTKGTHDFKIDEFNVYADTKELDKEYVVEFTADKAGEFVYYCTKPMHRENGHWGTLRVVG